MESLRRAHRQGPILLASRLYGFSGSKTIVCSISGVDMLDGTPLLDIKPYIPAFDCFPVQRVGWYQGKIAQGAVADDRFENHAYKKHQE